MQQVITDKLLQQTSNNQLCIPIRRVIHNEKHTGPNVFVPSEVEVLLAADARLVLHARVKSECLLLASVLRVDAKLRRDASNLYV